MTTTTKGIGGHHRGFRGRTDDWLTPPRILKALGEFDLDPCCPENMPWKTARTMYTPRTDGLLTQWKGRVWLNPPYGPDAERWMGRLAEHGSGTALIFARTETAAWFAHVWPRASAILFLEGRLHFHDLQGVRAKANSGGPSALIAYGHTDYIKLAECGLPGKLVVL